MNTSKIAELLKDHGIKPSYPRIQTYKYLYIKRNHPTVDEIFNSLISQIPTLSKTTIYNTLDLLIEANLVKSFNLGKNEKRYEVIIHDHAHFKCEKCNRIYDIPFDNTNLLPEGYEDFKINESQIFYKGICPECSK